MSTKRAKTPKYSVKASKKVSRVLHEFKVGKLHSGKSGKKVTDRKQAIAIGISEARRAGTKVPAQPVPPQPKTRQGMRKSRSK